MTFTEIVEDVAERLNLTSAEALARIGRRVNRRYRRITTRIGLVSFRRYSSSVSVTPATRDQTFTGEKVLSIKVSGATEPLDAISYAEMQEILPTTGDPTRWTLKRAGATTQVVQFDSTMDDGLDLIVEVEEAGSTLSDSQVPAFPESWHDVLVFGALADELRKKEKIALARDAEAEYERILGELAYHVAVNGYQDFFQGKKTSANVQSMTGAGSSSGSIVTHDTGALVANQLVVGLDGGGDVKSLGDLGTITKFLRGNAGGLPTFDGVVQADVSGLVAALALKAPLASPALTGVPTVPTAAGSTNTTQAASTAFVQQEIVAKAPLASPALTGTPTAPTAAAATNTTQIATTAFVEGEITAKAPLASPALTGTPTAPTAADGVNTTQLATTAFVMQERETLVTLVDGATPALDASLGTQFRLVAAGDRTIAVPTNPRSRQKIVIEHLASGGARTLALNTGAGGFRYGTDITALTATASGKTDYIGCIYNATDSKWDVVAVTKGF